MSERLDLMNECLALAEQRGPGALPKLLERLRHPDWRVRYAAAVALESLADPSAAPALVEALQKEEAAPLFSQKDDYGGAHAGSNKDFSVHLPADVNEETREAWRRRGRLKQAICLALGAVKNSAEPARLLLERCAVDQEQDGMVRAAACKALGFIGNPASLPALEQARGDQEWCTMTEARKSAQALARG